MGKYKWYWISGGVVVLFMVYYTVCSVMAVNRSVTRFNEAYWAKAEKMNDKEKQEMHRVPGYSALLEKRGLLDALVKVAKKDSIGLFLDLPDSIAQMMIKGVGVRKIRIENIRMSAFFKKTDIEAIYDLFARPMQITVSKATIAKEPINIVEAPKDSSDVIPTIAPDTANREPVFFILNTDQPVRFYFYQTGGEDGWQKFCFDLSDRWQTMCKTFAAVCRGRLPEYVPTIRIGISKADAKILYRALPSKGYIVVTR